MTAMRMLADPTRLRLLWLLRDGERNLLLGRVREKSSSALLRVEEGSLYPALHRLDKAGFIDAEWTVTENGRRVLYRARGGHVRRLLTEALHAADHQLTGAPEHD